MIVKGQLNTVLTDAKQLVYNVSAGKSFRKAFIREVKDGIIVEQYKVKDFDSPLGELVSSIYKNILILCNKKPPIGGFFL